MEIAFKVLELVGMTLLIDIFFFLFVTNKHSLSLKLQRETKLVISCILIQYEIFCSDRALSVRKV
jgi:hypothetical protein